MIMKYIIVIVSFWTGVVYGQKKSHEIEKLIDKYSATVSSQPDSAFYYITKATIESKKIQDDFLLSRCLYNLGYHYYLQNDLEKAEDYISQALPYARKAKNFKIQALAYNQLGGIELSKNNYNAALKKFLLSLDIADKYNLEKNKCYALYNLGSLYELQKDTIKALQYYSQNEKIALANEFKDVLLTSYNNIAILKRGSDKSTAAVYYRKAYDLAKELGDKYQEFAILINLSDLYVAEGGQKSHDKAYQCLLMAKACALQMGNEDNLFFVYFNLGGYHTKLKNYPEALKMYDKALELSKKGINEDQNSKLYSSIAAVYKAMGNYQQAYWFQEKFHSLQNQIFSVEKNKGFNDIQTKYEVEKKNLKIELLTKENIIEQNRQKFILAVGMGLLIIALLLVLFFRHRSKTQKIINETENKIFQQEKERLKQEQELKRVLGVIEGQDQERNRIAKEIHDGVGGQLAGIKLHLSQVNSVVKNDKIQIIINHLSSLFQELRAISHDLSLNYTKDKSLTALLEDLLQGCQNRNEFATDLVIFPEESLLQISENDKHQLYRIVQELVANISKHAGAQNVQVSITQHADFLNMIMEDDGCGFSDVKTKGIGLKNIEERLFAMNGKLTIETIKGKGSTIVVDIPR